MSRWRTIVISIQVAGLLHCLGARAAVPVGAVHEIACAPSESSIAAALINREVWVTTDEGTSWDRAARLPVSIGDTTSEKETEDIEFIEGFEDTSIRLEEADESSPSRRVSWESGATGTAGQASVGKESFSYRTHLAVSDHGEWSVAIDELLFAGSAGSGIRRRWSMPGIRGLTYDIQGRLWVAVKDALVLFRRDSGGLYMADRWPVRGAKNPTLDTSSRVLLIPGRDGLWIVSNLELPNGPEITLQRMPAVTAAAPLFGEKTWYFVSGQRIKKQRLGRDVEDLYPAPGRAEQLLVDADDGVLLNTGRAGWLEGTSGIWRPLSIRALAIDVLGRRWMGTEHGPVAPSRQRAISHFSGPMGKDLWNLANSAALELSRDPGPPSCRRLPIDPLPRTRLFFSWGRGNVYHVDTDNNEDSAGAATWSYVGIELTWNIRPIQLTDCLAPARRFNALKLERIQRTKALWSAWQKVHLVREASDNLPMRAAARMDEERLQELIRLASGTDPLKEEK